MSNNDFTWARVTYEVVSIEQKTVEIAVPIKFNKNKELLRASIMSRALAMATTVMSDTTIASNYDIKISKPKILSAYSPTSIDNLTSSDFVMFDDPLDITELEMLQEVVDGMPDPYNL